MRFLTKFLAPIKPWLPRRKPKQKTITELQITLCEMEKTQYPLEADLDNMNRRDNELLTLGRRQSEQKASLSCRKTTAGKLSHVRKSARRLQQLISALNAQIEVIKTDIHNIEPEDLRSITIATAEATGLPLAGVKTIR